LLGVVDLKQRGTRVPDREEQLRIFVTAGGVVTPVHEVHSFVRPGPRPGAPFPSVLLVKVFTSYAVYQKL
jgi:hypothetical protein